jgi:hypothetical protein
MMWLTHTIKQSGCNSSEALDTPGSLYSRF